MATLSKPRARINHVPTQEEKKKRKVKGRQEIKAGIDLVKYLMKNEVDGKLKFQLARLGETLNRLMLSTIFVCIVCVQLVGR